MDSELLQKYISGNANETEKLRITQWIQENPDHMREYMAQRKLHDVTLWQTASLQQENKKPEKKHFSLRKAGIELAKVAAIVAVVVLGSHYYRTGELQPESNEVQSIHVPAGQRAELTLSDGTKVWLNSLSTLTFPGTFSGDIRNVQLNGEGYFAVTSNEKQPFIVETNKCNVRVLGTEFNIMAYATDSVWEASLLKGKVELFTPGSSTSSMKLEPNTMASLKGNRLIKSRIQETDHFRWREGLICFNNITVNDMFEKLKLYYGVNIVVNNQKILTNRYTGKFRTNDGVEHVLRVLRLKHNFSYTRDDEKNIITIN